MTPEMLERRRSMAEKLGLKNLEFREGLIANLTCLAAAPFRNSFWQPASHAPRSLTWIKLPCQLRYKAWPE
jgi:hypothetical protein